MLANLQIQVRLSGYRHRAVEFDRDENALAVPIKAGLGRRVKVNQLYCGGSGARRRDPGRRALHLAGGVSGNAVMREIGRDAVGAPNGALIEVDGAGRHADAVGVIVVRLHPVVEPELPRICAAEIDGPPLLIANLQIQVRLSGYRHRAVECHHDENALAVVPISAAAAGRPVKVKLRYGGWGDVRRRCGQGGRGRGLDHRRAMHLAAGVSGNAVMREVDRNAVGVPNGVHINAGRIECDGAGRHTDAVGVIVLRLHPVVEPELVRIHAAEILGPPQLLANL